ncbi:MAG: amidohydrolase family protein [Planctomycetes bacterium]|nr:amidohydrolase family protein [Planctomycetota bacterium]
MSARLLAAVLLLAPAAPAQDLVVRADLLHTAAGPAVRDGVVVVRGGKIVAVGPAASVPVPAGLRVLHAAVATPGLVDAHTVVGLTGYLNQPTDQDQLDPSAPIQPELRAVDAYNARERLIEWVRGFGVTTMHTGHGPGALISGQTMVVKTRGDTVEQAVLVPRAALACTLGPTTHPPGEGKSPGTTGKELALLREKLVKAQAYRERRAAGGDKAPDRDLSLEVLADALDGRLPLMITAQRHLDIANALRLREEFGFTLWLDGAAEGYLMAPQIKAAGVPAIVHPAMQRPEGEAENLTFENAARLAAAGIPIALQSGFEDYVPKTRVLLYEAAIAARHGLGAEAALAACTLDAARLLGVDARVGSLEVGKDGDLALYDGDPFEYVTHCVATVIEGQVVFEGRR